MKVAKLYKEEVGKVDLINIHQNFPFALQSRVQHPQSLKLKQSFKS